jgi:hypothetical protein
MSRPAGSFVAFSRALRFVSLTLALAVIGACAWMRQSQYPGCLDLESECRARADCCSEFCANGECVENPYTGGSKLEPRGHEPSLHVE